MQDMMMGMIYGHLAGESGVQSRIIKDLGGKAVEYAKEFKHSTGVMSLVQSTKKSFICDDVAIRAVIRVLLRDLRMKSPFHKLLDKKTRDSMYVTAQEQSLDRRMELPLDLREWAPEFANRAGLMAISDSLELALREADPGSPLVQPEPYDEKIPGGKRSVYAEAYMAEQNMHSDMDAVMYGFTPFPFPYGIRDKTDYDARYDGETAQLGLRIDWAKGRGIE